MSETHPQAEYAMEICADLDDADIELDVLTLLDVMAMNGLYLCKINESQPVNLASLAYFSELAKGPDFTPERRAEIEAEIRELSG